MIERACIPRAALTLAALLLAACAGNAALPPGGSGSVPGSAKSATLTVVVHVAKRTPAQRRRHARWVSPSSQSIKLAFAPTAGGTPATFNINLTSGCTTSSGSRTCSETLGLVPGDYEVTVSTYDGPNETGNVLSHGESLVADVSAGHANELWLTLGGVPHAITVSAAPPALRGSVASGFTIYNAASQLLAITAQDADGNTIVGAGTPWTGSVTSGSGWAIEASPSPAHVNELSVTPPNSPGAASTLKISANYTDGTCALSGVVCSVSFNVVNDVQILAVTDCLVSCGGTGPDAVALYEWPYTTPFATITNGVNNPISAAVDASGRVYVGDCGSTCGSGSDKITIYAPPYTGAPTTITTGVNFPEQLAVDSSGDLLVDVCNTCNFAGSDAVEAYAHGNYTGAPTTVSGLDGQVDGMTVDPSNDLILAVCRHSCGYGAPADALLKYAPGYSGAPTANTSSIGFYSNTAVLAFDASGNLFVPNCYNCGTTPTYAVTKYASPYTGAPTATATSTIDSPLSVGVDVSDDLFVGNGPGGLSNNVSEYAPPYSSGSQILGGLSYQAYDLKVDALGDVIVSDGDTVKISYAPYTAAPTLILNPGSNSNLPFGLAP